MKDPIVVGALGGSGTRIVAQILEQWGVNMGLNLNESRDELLFTHLFKRPSYIHSVSDKKLQARLWAYGNLRMRGELHRKQHALWMREALEPIHGLDQQWVTKQIEAYKAEYAGDSNWGWKEPNSHIILPHLNAVFPKMKYIHVIRHGYAMAQSSNVQQLENWGMHYGISEKKIENERTKAKFHFWRVANLGAKLVGERLLGERFLMLRFEDLVNEPVSTLTRVQQFLEIEVASSVFDKAVGLIDKPSDFDRYENLTQEDVGDDGTSLPLFGYE